MEGDGPDTAQGVETLRIAPRFCGPPRSANGGYVCGLLARRIDGPALVRLRRPPPFDRELALETGGSVARLSADGEIVAEARASAPLAFDVPEPPSLKEAERAARGYAGYRRHAFPGCFVCGTARAPGDGLRVFVGPLDTRCDVRAGPWTPSPGLANEAGVVRPEFLWAALDCPGYWAVSSPGQAAVLGTLHGELLRPLESATPAIVLAWPLKRAGRRREAGTAVFDSRGRLCARARAIWIPIDPETFGAAA